MLTLSEVTYLIGDIRRYVHCIHNQHKLVTRGGLLKYDVRHHQAFVESFPNRHSSVTVVLD
jgi:hypothetical protein